MSKKIDQAEPVSTEAFDRLFGDYHQAIYRYCVRRLGTPDAEDAAAEVFAVAWRRINEMPDGEAVRAWLFGVAFRVVGNQFRSGRRRANLKRRIAAQRVEEDHALNLDVTTDRLLEALGSMGVGDAEMLRLSIWEGLSRREIAQVMKVKENTVDQRLFRARSRLRARFESLAPRNEPEEAST